MPAIINWCDGEMRGKSLKVWVCTKEEVFIKYGSQKEEGISMWPVVLLGLVLFYCVFSTLHVPDELIWLSGVDGFLSPIHRPCAFALLLSTMMSGVSFECRRDADLAC